MNFQPCLSLPYPLLSTMLLPFLQLSHLPLFSFHSCDFTLTTVHSEFLISPLLHDFSRDISAEDFKIVWDVWEISFLFIKILQHFISPLKPSKVLTNNYSSLLVQSKVLFDTLLKYEVLHVCFLQKKQDCKDFLLPILKTRFYSNLFLTRKTFSTSIL